MKKLFVVFGVLVFGVLLAGCSKKENNNIVENTAESLMEAKVSLKEYNKLTTGMEIEKVNETIGGVCKLILKTTTDNGEKLVYNCKGDSEHPASVTLIFIDNKLTFKEQHGLEENKES